MVVLRIANLFFGGRCISTIFNHANSRKAPKGQSLPQPPRPPLSPLPQLYLPPYWAPNSSPLLLLPEQKKHRQQKPRSPWNKRLQLHILRLKTLTLLHLRAPFSHMFLYLWRSHLVNFEYAFTLQFIYIQKITLKVNLTNWFAPTKLYRNCGYPDVFNHP